MDHYNRYSTFNRKVLSLAGLWHTQPRKERLLRYCVIGFMSLYNLLGELCQILTMNMDLRTAVRSLQISVPAICLTSVYYTYVFNFRTIQRIYDYIQSDQQRLKDDTELKIMQKYHYFCNILTFIFILTLYTYITLSIFPSLQRIILTSNEVRSDIDHYPIISCVDYVLDRRTYYYPLVMYQIMTSVLFGSLCISCYSTYFSFILHACANLSIIRYRILYPFITNDHDGNVLETPLDYTNWIIDIVQRFAKTKYFVALLNTSSEKCYLLQMFLAFVVLILDFLCIPVLLDQKEQRQDVIELITFIIGTLVGLYFNCYIGQRLINCSMDVYKEVCLVPIHEISLKTQKLLLTTLMVSSKPCAISIGKVYVSSHEFFSNIIQTALSFAMVVHSMQNI